MGKLLLHNARFVTEICLSEKGALAKRRLGNTTLLHWRSDANCRPGPTIKCFLFPLLTFAYNNIKLEKIMYYAYYNNKE